MEEIEKKLNNQEKFTIRLKSNGDFNKKITFKDKVKGTLQLPENDIDHVLMKSDEIPPYAFAHVVDDYLMRVTLVIRDDSYISSVPYHLEIWQAFGFKTPNYAHIAPLNKKDGACIRKLSKRKDPEAAVIYYNEKGIPEEAIKLYFATLLNSNFEEWYNANPTKSINNFKFTFEKMAKCGPIFDVEKLNNISKTYFSRLKALEIYEKALEYYKIYDQDFYNILNNNKDYTIKILNIEREIPKPRKDISCYQDIKEQTSYMFDELFSINNYQDIIKKGFYNYKILEEYFNNIYNKEDEKEVWWNKVKEYSTKHNFCPDVKEYKMCQGNYCGHVGDFCELIRVSITGRNITPDIYEILKLLDKTSIEKRIKLFASCLNK